MIRWLLCVIDLLVCWVCLWLLGGVIYVVLLISLGFVLAELFGEFCIVRSCSVYVCLPGMVCLL